MLRDISNIEFANCNAIIDDQTIIVYNSTNNYETKYKLINDKYYETSEVVYVSIPTGTTCYTEFDISSLPSKYDFATPFYHLAAILSVLLLFYLAYKLILYPWFRKI